MARGVWQNNIQTGTGDIVPGASIDVVNEATGLEIDVYAARTGGSVLSQPLYADANGYIKFYVEPSRIRVTATGVAGSQTFRDQLIMVPQESSTDATADRVMTVGAFGLGGTDAPSSTGADLNNLTVFGWSYQVSPTNGPPSIGTIFTVMNMPSTASGGRGSQIAQTNTIDEWWVRSQSGGAWSDWKEILKAGDYGLGGTVIVRSGLDMNDELPTGHYFASGGTNRPVGAINGWFTVEKLTSTDARQRYTDANSRVWERVQTSGVWQPWVEVYTEESLNTNVFGVTASNMSVATGFGISSTTCRFYLPINRTSPPVSITLTSTFAVRDAAQVLVGSSVSIAIQSALTSERLLVLDVSGLSGVTVGMPADLRSESVSSEIEVN